MKHATHVAKFLMLSFVFMWGCDGGYETKTPPSEEASADAPMMDAMDAPMTDAPAMDAQSGSLLAPAEVGGAADNNEGVGHYEQGHWDVAQASFQKAVAANANFAEAHYNLALTLDKMGNHDDAKMHFQMALDHGSDNPSIADSGILKAHLGM